MAQENGANTPQKNSPLYLLDAMALAYRAHFAFIGRPLMNSRGQNTSAAYGFTTTLLKLIEDHGITHMAVVFDVVGPGAGTFRDELFEEYKANRSPIPEDLAEALPCIKDIVEAAGVTVIEVPGVEADDVIGTLARLAAKEETDCSDCVSRQGFSATSRRAYFNLPPRTTGRSLRTGHRGYVPGKTRPPADPVH